MDNNHLVQLKAYQLGTIRTNKILLQNVNFTITKGSILCIQGLNGKGKTTILKLINELLYSSKGSLGIYNTQRNIKNYIFYLDSNPLFNENSTVYNYIFYWSILYNNGLHTSYEHIQKAIYTMGLISYSNTQISFLSLGQRKRVLLSKMILANRLIWVLDEPTIGLDKNWIVILYSLIEKHRNNGGIIIFATHTQIPLNKMTKIHII